MRLLIVIIIAVFVLAFVYWSKTEEVDSKRCKMTYGQEYILGHDRSNSSIKWCQAPDGTVKAL